MKKRNSNSRIVTMTGTVETREVNLKESTGTDTTNVKTTTAKVKKIKKTKKEKVVPETKVEKPIAKVSFTKIQIREYPIIVGDNPSIMTGVPLSIDWVHVNEINMEIDTYESHRPEARSMAQLKIPSEIRTEILYKQGFTKEQIRYGLRQANLVKGQRQKTNERTKELTAIFDFGEKMKRATVNATFGRGKKKKEKEFLNSFKKKKK